jgi:hypothetical protein
MGLGILIRHSGYLGHRPGFRIGPYHRPGHKIGEKTRGMRLATSALHLHNSLTIGMPCVT